MMTMRAAHLQLILSRGIPTKMIREMVEQFPQIATLDLDNPEQWAVFVNTIAPYINCRNIQWPPREQVKRVTAQLNHRGIELCWSGSELWPARLSVMGSAQPPWLFISSRSRLNQMACAVIGSRKSGPLFLKAAHKLGRTLARSGIVVVSGMAHGADHAAHQGSLDGVGSIAIPACGMLQVHDRTWRDWGNGVTWMTLDRPDANFYAGLAIRRNDIIAAMGDAVVLVAGDLKGGSSYAVKWALQHHKPVFCFAAGHETPPGNRHLIRQQLATPLPLHAAPEMWVECIHETIRQRAVPFFHKETTYQLNFL